MVDDAGFNTEFEAAFVEQLAALHRLGVGQDVIDGWVARKEFWRQQVYDAQQRGLSLEKCVSIGLAARIEDDANRN